MEHRADFRARSAASTTIRAIQPLRRKPIVLSTGFSVTIGIGHTKREAECRLTSHRVGALDSIFTGTNSGVVTL